MIKPYENFHNFILRMEKEQRTTTTRRDNVIKDIVYTETKDMTKEELLELVSTHEEHHNEHHEAQEDLKEELEQWRETVGEIFDLIAVNSNTKVDDISKIIEENHYDYFYMGQPITETTTKESKTAIKETPFCTYCNADQTFLSWDATAMWNDRKQDFFLVDVIDTVWCGPCDSTTKVGWKARRK